MTNIPAEATRHLAATITATRQQLRAELIAHVTADDPRLGEGWGL